MTKTSITFLLALVLMVGVPSSLSAKGGTARIIIKGSDLKAPVEITNPAILAKFNVWTGPGTSSNESKGLIVDWSQGKLSHPPEGLSLYEVFFYTNSENQEKLVYEVSYEYNPATRSGYVYLPGKGDKWFHLDMGSIIHGVEGNWFSAWSLWDDTARPLIDRAKANASAKVQ